MKIKAIVTTVLGTVIALTASTYAAGIDLMSLLQKTVPSATRFTQNNSWNQNPVSKQVKTVQAVYNAFNGDKQVAVIVRTAGEGYSGVIHQLVALDMDGTVLKVNVFSHTETPSYVVPINNGSFQRQFEGITLKDKMSLLVGQRATKRGEIQAITDGTTSSKPIAIGVSEARKIFAGVYSN